ncbi:hypothetical protein [Aestuariivivens sediminis]|uniref:hypothetical protein n=1 Tax=Aestuariivivens sediminis TaxID=2913557 RepID=UPI001F59446A|nr:hypothetical protein [Aestuariivivens sediminis]
MKRANFHPYIWAFSPITSYVLANLEEDEREIKELILKNTRHYNLGVSEMHLNVTKLTAIDSSGIEHFILDFPNQMTLNIKGIGYGHFYKLKKISSLPSNTYTHFRFYLGSTGNTFHFKDGAVENKNACNYLDFEIENKVTLNGGNPSEAKIWFDMVPYEFKRHFKWFTEWLHRFKNLKSSIQNAY